MSRAGDTHVVDRDIDEAGCGIGPSEMNSIRIPAEP
jgi:hypothetical protein